MGYEKALGMELRVVQELERAGESVRAVEGSRLYPTDREDLWDALTSAERLPRWFLPVQGDLELGGRFALEGNAEGTVLRCDPPEVLEVTWEFAGNVSWVEVRLDEEVEGTRLTLVHSMPRDAASEEHWATFGPGATGVGWDLAFFGLGLYFEGGKAKLDGEAFEAWSATEPGKVFVRACAESWGHASIAAGEAEEVARAQAARTGNFYTGA